MIDILLDNWFFICISIGGLVVCFYSQWRIAVMRKRNRESRCARCEREVSTEQQHIVSGIMMCTDCFIKECHNIKFVRWVFIGMFSFGIIFTIWAAINRKAISGWDYLVMLLVLLLYLVVFIIIRDKLKGYQQNVKNMEDIKR